MEKFRKDKDDRDDSSYCVERTEAITVEFYESVSSGNVDPTVLETASSSKLAPLQSLVPIQKGIKHYGVRMRLYCRTGYNILILPDGTVGCDALAEDNTGILEFSSAGIGEIRIRGVHANLYLAMNENGDLYGEEDPRNYATVFVEGIYGQYNTYLSQKYAHKGWYVGVKKNGTIKKGLRTRWGQKAIQFLPIRVNT